MAAQRRTQVSAASSATAAIHQPLRPPHGQGGVGRHAQPGADSSHCRVPQSRRGTASCSDRKTLRLTAAPASGAAPPSLPPLLPPSSVRPPPQRRCRGRAAGRARREGRAAGPIAGLTSSHIAADMLAVLPCLPAQLTLPTHCFVRQQLPAQTVAECKPQAAHLDEAGHVGVLAVAPCVQPLLLHGCVHLLPARQRVCASGLIRLECARIHLLPGRSQKHRAALPQRHPWCRTAVP